MKLTDKIDISLSESDLAEINKSNANDMSKFMARLRDSKFNIGDVLIKRTKRSWYEGNKLMSAWQTVMVPYRSVPRKFVVVHVDEHGIPSVKPLTVTGKLGKDIKCFNDIDFRYEIFEEDPDYAAAIILGDEEYDPIEHERNGGRRKREKAL